MVARHPRLLPDNLWLSSGSQEVYSSTHLEIKNLFVFWWIGEFLRNGTDIRIRSTTILDIAQRAGQGYLTC